MPHQTNHEQHPQAIEPPMTKQGRGRGGAGGYISRQRNTTRTTNTETRRLAAYSVRTTGSRQQGQELQRYQIPSKYRRNLREDAFVDKISRMFHRKRSESDSWSKDRVIMPIQCVWYTTGKNPPRPRFSRCPEMWRTSNLPTGAETSSVVA